MKGMGLLGRKLGMTRIFTEDGTAIPVTVIDVGGNVVVQKKTENKDNYTALQIGFDDKPLRVSNKPSIGHFQKAGIEPKRILREFRISIEAAEKYEVGQPIDITMFKPGDKVDITGKNKGKGFAGVMKRYNFRGAKATHGVHEYFRHGGSLGQNMTPGRVFKGHKMPGHQGDKRVTTQNIKIVQIREDDNAILVQGSVPGSVNSYVVIRRAIKTKKRKA